LTILLGGKMKLFLISRTDGWSWDEYDSAVVVAPDEETARTLGPDDGKPIENWKHIFSSWTNDIRNVKVKYLGEAAPELEQGVVCSSFNAG
jgi:hypothetical protein